MLIKRGGEFSLKKLILFEGFEKCAQFLKKGRKTTCKAQAAREIKVMKKTGYVRKQQQLHGSSTYHSMCQALAGHITYMVWPHPFNTSMRWLLFCILPLKSWSSLFKPEGYLLLHHQIFPSRGGWRATGELRKDARWRQARKSRLQLDKTIWSYEPEWKKTLVKHEKYSVQNK